MIILCSGTLLFAASVDAASHASWISLKSDTQKQRADTAAQIPITVDVEALFAHIPGETRSILVNGGRTLAITGLRVLDGHDGARTWVGMHRDGGSEHNVFVT